MLVDVKKIAQQDKTLEGQLLLDERLPYYIAQSFIMNYRLTAESKSDFILFKVNEIAEIPVICQRCSDSMYLNFHSESLFAVCPSDALADKYQSQYEVIVASDFKIDLKDILIDNLHLISAPKHENIEQCNQDKLKLMQNG